MRIKVRRYTQRIYECDIGHPPQARWIFALRMRVALMRARYKNILPLRLYENEWPCCTESAEELRDIIPWVNDALLRRATR